MRLPASLLVVAVALVAAARADERLAGIACRSVHLGYRTEPGTAFYNELSVEESADGTYFMACGWSKGYFGIQELANGKKLVLFSVWDPAAGDNPASVPAEKRVKTLHKDSEVRVGRFGNEGTGGQAFFDYDWKPKTTCRFLVTAAADGDDRTAYSGYFYIHDTREWKHLVTFSTLTRKDEALRGCYSFVEDFRRNKISATKVRKATFGNGWVKLTRGQWQMLDKARFTADANPVLNIDAGVAEQRFFLATGGATANTTTRLQETITRPAAGDRPPGDLPAGLSPPDESRRVGLPNIVLMYADNLGYGDLGCYGNREVKTPRLDRLASEGVRCTDFYVVCPTCTVSRGAILTGRQPLRNGLTHQLVTTENFNGIGLPHRERIIPQYLAAAGYETACFGKWNIGFAAGSRPTERGFDEFLGCRSGNIHYFKHTYHGEYDIFQGTERHPVEGYSTDIFADAACDFLRRKAGRPVFVYLPFNAPHYVSKVNTSAGEQPQWHVPGKYLEQYGWPADDATEKHRYLALVTALDDAVGRVLDTLEATEQRNNTLVMFISDMGAILRPTHGLGVATNAPFRDGAPSLYEGGIRVPAIFRWPGKLKPHTRTEMLSQLDILPLCMAAAGIQPPSDRVLDGRDPLPTLTGTAKSPHQRLVFTYRAASALREGTLKIVRSAATAPWELYDVAVDAAESNDLAPQRPADVARLDAAYQTWLADVRHDASPPAPRP